MEVTPGEIQLTTFKDIDKRCHVQAYADDITLVIQFPEKSQNRKQTEKIIQKYLLACQEWNQK